MKEDKKKKARKPIDTTKVSGGTGEEEPLEPATKTKYIIPKQLEK